MSNESRNNFQDSFHKKPTKTNIDFVASSLDDFDANAESKIYACHRKAVIIAQRVKTSELAHGSADSYIKSELNIIKNEWPALFGAPVTKLFVHLDLDSFYASVETLFHPQYKNVPMAVGSKMMLAAVNYKAREYGIKSGMPGYKALRLCPELKIHKCNFSRYSDYSESVMEIISSYDENIEIYGLDECCISFDEQKLERAYANYNNSLELGRNRNSAIFKTYIDSKETSDLYAVLDEKLHYNGFSPSAVFKIIEKIRAVVFRNTGLTLSGGISVCRGLAKLSSKINNPNGQFMIDKNFDEHLLDLEVDQVNGIGKSTKELLDVSFGIKYIRDLRNKLPECAVAFKKKVFCKFFKTFLWSFMF